MDIAIEKNHLYYLYNYVSSMFIYFYIFSQCILIFYLITCTGLNFKHQILLNSYKINFFNTVIEKYFLIVYYLEISTVMQIKVIESNLMFADIYE